MGMIVLSLLLRLYAGLFPRTTLPAKWGGEFGTEVHTADEWDAIWAGRR